MTSAIFALFNRSLRDDMRSRPMAWARTGMAAAILLEMSRFSMFATAGAAGRDFFAWVTGLNAIFISIATLSYFAGAITEEKEEGTLSLLRMTDLNPLAILLGKSTSRLCGGLIVLLVQFPFSLLSVTLGGLRWEQVAACYGLLAAFLFFGANIGLLGSVLARRTPGAAIITGCLGVFLVLGGNPMAEFLDMLFPTDWPQRFPLLAGMVETWRHVSVGDALNTLLYDPAGRTSSTGPAPVLITYGCIAFLCAWLLFDRCCDDGSAEARPSPWGKKWARPFLPLRHGRPWWGWQMEAVVWKDFHFIHGGWRIVIAKAVAYITIAAWFLYDDFKSDMPARFHWTNYFPAAAGLSFLALWAECLFATSRIFRVEKIGKTFSGLAILPFDLPELISTKRKAILLSILPIGLAFGLTFFAALALNFQSLARVGGEMIFYGMMLVAWVAGQFVLNLRLVALFSLRMKWGGLPLSLALSSLANSFATMFAFFIFHAAASFMLPMATWFIAVGLKGPLHRQIELGTVEG